MLTAVRAVFGSRVGGVCLWLVLAGTIAPMLVLLVLLASGAKVLGLALTSTHTRAHTLSRTVSSGVL